MECRGKKLGWQRVALRFSAALCSLVSVPSPVRLGVEFHHLFSFFFISKRERKGRRKRRRETSMCGCLLYAPYWGPGQQPRLVP